MNYVRKLSILLVAGLMLNATAGTEPSTQCKVLSTVAAPLATYGTVVTLGYGLDKLALQHLPVVGNGTLLAGTRPYLVGVGALYTLYHLSSPMSHYFYSMFSGDVEYMKNSIVNIGDNQKTIKSILKEIWLVKNRLVGNFKPWVSAQVMTIFQEDACWQKLSGVLSGDYDSSDKLPTLNKLAGYPLNKDYDHWYSLGFVKTFISVKNAVVGPFVGSFESASQQSKIAGWNFEVDERLLVTWGGSKIEEAARNILTIFNHNDLIPENMQKFQANAKIIIDYAAEVLGQLTQYTHSMKRVLDLADCTDKFANYTEKTVDNVATSVKDAFSDNDNVPDFSRTISETANKF